jgi:Zn-dependent protease with chaperone function
VTNDGDVARERVLLTGISSRAYEHPADRTALTALRGVRGFDEVLKWLSGLMRERSHRLMYLASTVRVSDRQFADVHNLVVDGGRILDLPTLPETFVVLDPQPQAMTLGMDQPFLVLTSGLVELLDAEELRFVIGHELGHVLSGHAVYRTMLNHLLALSRRVFWLPIGYLGLRTLLAALEEWYRKSELSCDRAGLLAGQDPAAALRAQMKLAGGGNLGAMDITAFLDQAREYDATGSLRDGLLKLFNLEGQRHPLAAVRAAELRAWVDGGDYQRILGGDYPRREDDDQASTREDAREAAASYKKKIDESADALTRLLKNVGEEVVAAGVRIADRVRERDDS